MASITIRKLDDEVKTRLRVRAAENGRSMEEEAQVILREAVGGEPEPKNLVARSFASVSRPMAAWTWNCHRASPCASRPNSTE